MTNNQIIEQAVQQQFSGDPEKLSLAYHTFEAWKQLGFSVRKGEHAVLSVYLWKKAAGSAPDLIPLKPSRLIVKTDFSRQNPIFSVLRR